MKTVEQMANSMVKAHEKMAAEMQCELQVDAYQFLTGVRVTLKEMGFDREYYMAVTEKTAQIMLERKFFIEYEAA